MSTESPQSSARSTSPEITPELLAAAAQRRAQQGVISDAQQEIKDYEQRQAFRRLIDPGILRPNSKDVATASLKVPFGLSYSTLCDAHVVLIDAFNHI